MCQYLTTLTSGARVRWIPKEVFLFAEHCLVTAETEYGFSLLRTEQHFVH